MGDEQLSLFDFGYDENGDYVNFKEVEAEQERLKKEAEAEQERLKKEEEKRLKLTEEEIENICRYFDLRRDCESCPLDKTRYCYQRYEPEENDVCKCTIKN